MSIHSKAIFIIVATLSWPLSMVEFCFAGEAPFTRRLTVIATALSDERLETVSTEDIAIRSQAAISAFGQIILPVNEHFTDLEFQEAATFKADGRRLEVRADKLLVSNLPNAPQLGIFQADVKLHTIVFPDVAVGDTVHYKVRIKDRRRGISGGFSVMRSVPPASRFDEINITLDVPKALPVNESFSGFARAMEETDQRRRISWTLGPQPYRANEPNATASIDRDPYLVFSSYPDWQAIGQKFFDGAAPMSEPTAELRALAEEITKGITDRRAQARAIYDWVSSNVRYFAIFLGQGSFVPHDATSVLANKYGDCKDHVTLMRALLAARGIEADYALLSLEPVYRDLQVPAPDWFNHVILWIPEFNQYVDPTASGASFESLPGIEADKRVLRISSTGIALARTPPLTAENNWLSITSDIVLSPDGTAKGVSMVAASGSTGARLRGTMAQVAVRGGEAFAKELLSKQNWRGTGDIEAREMTDRHEPFAVKTSFELTNRFLGDDSNKNAVPVGPRLVEPAWIQFSNVIRDKRAQDFVCEAQTYEQVIDLHLPDGQTLTNVPGTVAIVRPNAAFEAHHDLDGQTLHIVRRMVTRVPGQSCSPESAMVMVPVIEAAAREFNWHPQFAHSEGKPAPSR